MAKPMPEFVAFLIDWLSPLGAITVRPMMGGWAVYADGVVFALVADDVVFLKVDSATKGQFEAEGLEAFRPFGEGGVTMSYHRAPEDFLDSRDAMERWGGMALAAARRMKKKPRKPVSSRKSVNRGAKRPSKKRPR